MALLFLRGLDDFLPGLCLRRETAMHGQWSASLRQTNQLKYSPTTPKPPPFSSCLTCQEIVTTPCRHAQANIRFQMPVVRTTAGLKVRATSCPGQVLFEKAAQLVSEKAAELVVLGNYFLKCCAARCPGHLWYLKAAQLVVLDNYLSWTTILDNYSSWTTINTN